MHTWNFSQCFGPTWCWIGHHRNIVTHISKVLRQSNSCVDRRFSCSYWHVGSVGYLKWGMIRCIRKILNRLRNLLETKHCRCLIALILTYQRCSSHDWFSLTIYINRELREISKYFCHFITTLTATDVDNYITVTILRERLRNDCFSTSKSP